MSYAAPGPSNCSRARGKGRVPGRLRLKADDIDLLPASETMEAVITGTNLSRPLAARVADAVREAFLEHHVLAFRDQSLDQQRMHEVAALLDEVEQHRVQQADGSKWDAVHLITDLGADGLPAERPFTSSTYFWHTDKSFLHAAELPPTGGDIAAAPPVAHPIVCTHPETDRNSVDVGMYSSHVKGMPEDEGNRLPTGLLAHATEERSIYRHAWRPSDVVLWDNRCLLHRASRNYEKGKYRRVVVPGSAPC